MKTIKLHANGNVILTEDGNVSCECCGCCAAELLDCYVVQFNDGFGTEWEAFVYRVSACIWQGYADYPECGNGLVVISISGTPNTFCYVDVMWREASDDGGEPPIPTCINVSHGSIANDPQNWVWETAFISGCSL